MFGPLKSLLFLAVLWLPLSFFVWFYLRQLWVQPIAAGSGAILGRLFDGSFLRVDLEIHEINFVFDITHDGRVAELAFMVNPLIYGYCLPVLAGLVMATPLSGARRALQLFSGIFVLLGVQIFGTVFDALKQMGVKQPDALSMTAGSQGDAEMLRPFLDQVREMTLSAVSADVIAFGYQFGYLVLPAIMPVILWVLFNQAFIRGLVTTEGSELPEAGTAARD